MALTDLQKSRIAFHLDVWSANSLLTVDRNIKFYALSEEDELSLVGPENPTDPQLFEGQVIASQTSILGRLESALANISPSVIDNSLLVKTAGKVTLRGNELRLRQQLYKAILKELAKLMGYRLDVRVGF
jgi:hypothetical protein